MDDLVSQQNVLGDLAALEKIEKFAGLMASAKVSIPAELQNKPGDCLALCLQAQAWGMNSYPRHKKPMSSRASWGTRPSWSTRWKWGKPDISVVC